MIFLYDLKFEVLRYIVEGLLECLKLKQIPVKQSEGWGN